MSPAVVASSSSPSSSKADMKGHARKTREVRRPARGKREEDEGIERVAMSDESDSEDTIESDTDSDSEAESTMQTNGQVDAVTPRTTQSPQPTQPAKVASPSSEDPPRSAPAFFSASDKGWMVGGTGDWSEMVADEGANGTAQLPVIDFADLNQDVVDAPAFSKESDKSGTEPEVTVTTSKEQEDKSPESQESARRGSVRGGVPRRALGHAVRQQYQQRLQSDPSFVPTVGEFWGHDPRLIPEDMRSMSDWWRDRKFARGRGRGMMSHRGFRGRGRGGFNGQSHAFASQAVEDETAAQDSPTSPDVPSIDRAWTHDGFEEMRRREDKRKAEQQQKRPFKPYQRRGDVSPASSSSRGGFIAGRGRGGFISGRGGFHVRRNSFSSNAKSDRVWYIMKPERTWTKQLEGFLHFDNFGKPWSGKPSGFRVHLPGKRSDFVKAPATAHRVIAPADVRTQAHSDAASATEREKTYVVRLPKVVDPKENPETFALHVPESLTTVEEPKFDESPVATTSRVTVEMERMKTSAPSAPVSPVARRSEPSNSASLPVQTLSEDTVSTPGLTRENSVSEVSVQEPQSSIPPTQSNGVEEERLTHPHLPPLQTVFAPTNQPSPTYASPYVYPPQLPPGVAFNHQGYPYEVASGRPVFLQPTPPPPVPLYNPRPMQHNMHTGMPFVPGHMHHASLPPDFMPMHPHTPPVNGYVDPQMGAPLFSLPRQSSRVEIRAPSDSNDGVKGKGERKPSGLRNSTVNGESSVNSGTVQHQQTSNGQVYYGQSMEYGYTDMGRASSQMYQAPQGTVGSPNSDGAQLQQSIDPSAVGYDGYQQYYYPGYGYPAYMPSQYDPYAGDPNQSAGYY
ncbi:hypothetical protein SCHPADRAFT_898495 [Schizopora paradoxa]|uniref:Btz domain-containing protein n=1 Tax=Schizopora paradoxa TaxID=27342 RepID=A0A0H2S6U9_9AGAM|nr:hypothetical protein SCHPADRAFT_898495 [Schizopora paradoxa]